MLDDKKDRTFFKEHEFVFSFVLFVIFISAFVLSSGDFLRAKSCGDGTLYNECSATKPYFCDNGFLIEKASICGCDKSSANGDSCVSQYQIDSKEIGLNYLFDGEENALDFTAYEGLTKYLSSESKIISYQNGRKPERVDFELKILNNEQQRQLLLPLAIRIQNMTKNKVDQARIAISIVQNIEYGFSNKTDVFFGQEINYSRYPYEVLTDNEGICGEKSELLAFLLREIGYGTAIFYNQQENHQAIGILCPREESYKKTGYCFVETTAPAIISDDEIEYSGSVFLTSEPEVLLISDGISLPHGLPEYRDAEIMKSLRTGKLIFFKDFELNRLREKYGLDGEYYLA